MLCERCHKQLATLRYSEVVDGKAIARNICRACMDEISANSSIGFEMSGSAPPPRRELFSRVSGDTMPKHMVCPSCGTELAEALKSGRVGCTVCYETFSDQLEAALRGRHPGLMHRGKTPHRDESRERLRMDLRAKRALLRSALKMEDYEEAAVLRDEIKRLEAELGSVPAEQD